jgi:hypothetical protein
LGVKRTSSFFLSAIPLCQCRPFRRRIAEPFLRWRSIIRLLAPVPLDQQHSHIIRADGAGLDNPVQRSTPF